jgi:hypothetical protein
MALKYKILKDFNNALIDIDNVLGTDKKTNNIQLDNLGKIIFGNRFKGVYTADARFQLKNNEMCIINTDPSTKKGLHWIAIYKYNNRKYFYDSFARDYRKLSPYFKNKRWVNIKHNVDESMVSEDCGQLALATLIIFDKYHDKIIGVI